MELPELTTRVADSAELTRLSALVGKARRALATGIPRGSLPMLGAALAVRLQSAVLLVARDEEDAAGLRNDIGVLCPALPLDLLRAEPASLASLADATESGGPRAFVVIAEHLTTAMPLPRPERELRLVVRSGGRLVRDEVVGWLEDARYERTDLVTEEGEYAARGGIIDIFPDGAEQPVRVELVDDEADSLRAFDPLTQRSTGTTDSVTVTTRRPPDSSGRSLAVHLPPAVVMLTGLPFENCTCRQVVLDSGEDADVDLHWTEATRYLGNLSMLRSELGSSELDYVVACGSENERTRLAGILGEKPYLLPSRLSRGFACPGAGFVLLTERELYGRSWRRPVRHRFKGLPVDNLVTLRPGDHVVHIDYGIGVFEGTERVRHGEHEKDYLVLRYAGRDKVFVPVENLGLLDRYVGAKDARPRLDRIGGRSWLTAKAKAARSSAEYAEELLELQARRTVARRPAFPPDGEWQRTLEDNFAHDETRDQRAAMDAVRQDMRGPRPMDRLVCGDVGYGKTEVALRAAVRAVAATRQVAMLVPTTILSYQHHATMRRRLGSLPVRIETLSRLVSPSRRREILADTARGRVDIVIGTHLLLSGAVKFRDLGLLIIDEEQKFGVKQKEDIKRLSASVDVLTLTATPVPRTLYMAMAGLRDISTIHTPPPGRREVLTEVASWSDDLLSDYLDRELRRDGQVFFVHNRVRSLNAVARRIQHLLPGVDMAVAHGQMPGRELERLYVDFAAGGHRILLSTAIIESGLDLPNVNTIIVDRADTFGLADLHQLRGRVGRAGRQAYALFLVPRDSRVTPEARKRLSALLAYSQLGAGFRLALRDLEIRGAGDLLGTRQHGHVARVGLNLYAKMLRESAARIRGEKPESEPELSLDVSAYFPSGYVPDSFERVALYRRMLGLDSLEELGEFDEELRDRFGRYPSVVANLFLIARVRVLARKLGLLRVETSDRGSVVVSGDSTVRVDGGLERLVDFLAREVARS